MRLPTTTTVPRSRQCTCSHSEIVHELNGKRIRTWCTVWDEHGKCPCRKFKPEEDLKET